MSQNFNDNDTTNTTGGTGSTGYGGTGTTDTGLSRTGTGTTGGGTATGTATAPAGIAAQAKEYGQKVSDAATNAASKAKEYLSDKATVAGEKIQDLRNVDYAQLAEDAKDYARQRPGQAILIAAAAGFVVGLLLRGGRR